MFDFKLASFLSSAQSVETRREELREHLHSEVKHNMMEPQFSDIEEWVTKGLHQENEEVLTWPDKSYK